MYLKKIEGYEVVGGRYVKIVDRPIKAKVKKSWPHLGKKTVVGVEVSLSSAEYFFVLEQGLVDKSPDAPLAIAAGEEVAA
jgi:hypothetical protein